ncbi:MAG TPA: hypothetical protein VGG72_07580 [Bryobacteraceae bacterium]|jgi:hypothetical protein
MPQIQAIISPSPRIAVSSCYITYDPYWNSLYLMNDAATGWVSASPPLSGILHNSQCTINLGQSSFNPPVPGSNNFPSVTLSITFTPANQYQFPLSTWSGMRSPKPRRACLDQVCLNLHRDGNVE